MHRGVEYITVKEAAYRNRCSLKKLYEAVHDGKFETVQVGKQQRLVWTDGHIVRGY